MFVPSSAKSPFSIRLAGTLNCAASCPLLNASFIHKKHRWWSINVLCVASTAAATACNLADCQPTLLRIRYYSISRLLFLDLHRRPKTLDVCRTQMTPPLGTVSNIMSIIKTQTGNFPTGRNWPTTATSPLTANCWSKLKPNATDDEMIKRIYWQRS